MKTNGKAMTPEQLKAIRKRLRMTQLELAIQLGVRENTVYRWEAGIHPIMPLTERVIRMIGKEGRR